MSTFWATVLVVFCSASLGALFGLCLASLLIASRDADRIAFGWQRRMNSPPADQPERPSEAQEEWQRLQDALARTPAPREPQEEPFGVTEFVPVEPVPFNPDEWLDELTCSACGREPLAGEPVYEVPVGDGSLKVLCNSCGKVKVP